MKQLPFLEWLALLAESQTTANGPWEDWAAFLAAAERAAPYTTWHTERTVSFCDDLPGVAVAPYYDYDHVDHPMSFALTHPYPQELPCLQELGALCKTMGVNYLGLPFVCDHTKRHESFSTLESGTIDLSPEDLLAPLNSKRRYRAKQALASFNNLDLTLVFEAPLDSDVEELCAAVAAVPDMEPDTLASLLMQTLVPLELDDNGQPVHFVCAYNKAGALVAVQSFIESSVGLHKHWVYQAMLMRQDMVDGKFAYPGLSIAMLYAAARRAQQHQMHFLNVTEYTSFMRSDMDVYKSALCSAILPVHTIAVKTQADSEIHPPYFEYL